METGKAIELDQDIFKVKSYYLASQNMMSLSRSKGAQQSDSSITLTTLDGKNDANLIWDIHIVEDGFISIYNLSLIHI